MQVKSSIASKYGKVTIPNSVIGIYKDGGLLSFWRGNLVNVIKNIPESAIMFASFELFKVMFCEDLKNPRKHEYFIAGSLSGFFTRSCVYPLDITKTRMVAAPTGTYRGILHCITLTYRKEGWKGFYHGLLPSLSGVVPYLGINFTIYETLKSTYVTHKRNDMSTVPPTALLACGATASAVAQLAVYPSAIVMTRLQAQGTAGHLMTYNGMTDCIMRIWRNDGIKGMYRGLSANYLKTIPSMALSYLTYESAKNALCIA